MSQNPEGLIGKNPIDDYTATLHHGLCRHYKNAIVPETDLLHVFEEAADRSRPRYLHSLMTRS